MSRFGLRTRTGLIYDIIQSKSVDVDAQSFFNRVNAAGGTLTALEQTAVNLLVGDLKTKGLWTSMKAIYPMVGSSAAACAQNLVSSSFTGTFYGGWTFTSTGTTPNGSNGYMDTNFNAFLESLPLDNTHFSIYSRTNITSTGVMIGNNAGGGAAQSNLFAYNPIYVRINSLNTNTSLPSLNLSGFIICSRKLSTTTVTYKNTTTYSELNPSFGVANISYHIGNVNSSFYDSNNYAFASIGLGLTDTQASDFYTAVQTFQTTLSRQV